MSDATVAAALRSAAPLVVIEAPGGCGKTYQGANYASDAGAGSECRVLILTHTHAACDVFAKRTRSTQNKVEIRTLDSLIGQIASAYHAALGLPADVAMWCRLNRDGYHQVAAKVAHLIDKKSIIADALARRYPVIVCDEHQDATVAQEQIILAIHKAGAQLRIFADPMQRIFGNNRAAFIAAEIKRWSDLKQQAGAFEELDTPHRWALTNPALGEWILAARTTLRDGGRVDLRGALPGGLRIIRADNSATIHGRYQLTAQQRLPLTQHMQPLQSCLVVAAHNDTVSSLRAFFNRSIPIWEGHTREALDELCSGLRAHNGHPSEVGMLAAEFVSNVAKGFTAADYCRQFLEEIAEGCTKARRNKPAAIQSLSRIILEEPNHRGVGKFLAALRQLSKHDPAFRSIKIDHVREFNDAIYLGRFENADEGLAEIARRRAHARMPLPNKAISTIHKSKGLEFPHVVIAACDRSHFADTQASRAKLYVGLSRATESLALMVSHTNPSPLFLL